MKVLMIALCMATLGLSAQPKKATERVTVAGQKKLDLDFAFADEIRFEVWDKKEVLVEVSVEINGGDDNDIFSLSAESTESTIYIEMDKKPWKDIEKKSIYYTIYLPKGLIVKSETISGNYQFEYFGVEVDLKTISGSIDITVPKMSGFDFKAKTISGEVFSDIDIKYPEGKEGLRKPAGQNFKGRINEGGVLSRLETISGNIYLRKG